MKIALLPFAGKISNGALLRLINIFGEEGSQRVRLVQVLYIKDLDSHHVN